MNTNLVHKFNITLKNGDKLSFNFFFKKKPKSPISYSNAWTKNGSEMR